ncbi:hypothetical protein AAY473_011467 [Plecturocebus cupreus]
MSWHSPPPSLYGGLSPWLDTCPPVPPGSDPRGRLALGLAPGQWSSSRCPVLGALKLRPFLVPWSPALSCVSSSPWWGPLTLTDIGMMVVQAGKGSFRLTQGSPQLSLGALVWPREPAHEGDYKRLQDAMGSQRSSPSLEESGHRTHGVEMQRFRDCTELIALNGTDPVEQCAIPWRLFEPEVGGAVSLDVEPQGSLVLGPVASSQRPSAMCPVPSALKCGPFWAPWSPALSCGEHIQVLLGACAGRGCPGLGR